MVAYPTWVGTTGAWDTAANWNPATAPLDADLVYFTGASVVSVTSGLTLPGAGDAFALLSFGPGWTGACGSSGSKLICAAVTTIRMAARGGSAFLSVTGCTDCILESAGGTTDFFELAGTCTSIRAIGCSGSWSVTAGSAITNLIMSASPNCTCTIGTGVTALARIDHNGGGRIVNSSAVTSVIVGSGSEYRQEVGAITTLRIGQGAVCRYNAVAGPTTVIVEPGGIFDGRENRATATPGTVTIGTLEAYPGSSVYLNSGLQNWRVLVDKNCGGNVVAQPGYTTAI